METYQSIIINFQNKNLKNISSSLKIFSQKYEKYLETNGTLWVFCNNLLLNNKLQISSFLLPQLLNRYKLKNIILIPKFDSFKKINFFNDYTYQILFFSKTDKYFFNKDPIREKHIWKNVEWGKRKKNYHPKGKDPGNVWLTTKDDGKGKITEHIPLSYTEVLNRTILLSTKTKKNCLLLNFEKKLLNINNIFLYYGKI